MDQGEVVGLIGVGWDLADALSCLLEKPDYRTSLGRAANLRCREMFDWDIVAGHWASILEEV